MKKLFLVMAVLVALVGVAAFGEGMLARDYSVEVIDTATNSQNFVIRGYLEGVHIEAPSNATGTVSVVTRDATLFTVADVTADVTYYPVVQAVNSTGTVVSAEYTKYPLAGDTTVQVIGGSAGTNTWPVHLIFRP